MPLPPSNSLRTLHQSGHWDSKLPLSNQFFQRIIEIYNFYISSSLIEITILIFTLLSRIPFHFWASDVILKLDNWKYGRINLRHIAFHFCTKGQKPTSTYFKRQGFSLSMPKRKQWETSYLTLSFIKSIHITVGANRGLIRGS